MKYVTYSLKLQCSWLINVASCVTYCVNPCFSGTFQYCRQVEGERGWFHIITKAGYIIKDTQNELLYHWHFHMFSHRLVIKMYPESQSVLEELADDSIESVPFDSLNGACIFSKTEASPFSSKKVMYEHQEVSCFVVVFLPVDRVIYLCSFCFQLSLQ